MRKIGAHSESTGMIGDRMDTDVVAGIEAGLHTVLVLTGIADDAEIAKRRAVWKAPAPRYTRGVQAKFAFNASTASKGAVLDNY